MMKPGNVPTACTDRNSLFEGQEIAFTINIFFKRDFSSREIVFTIIFFEKVFFEKVGSFSQTFSQSFSYGKNSRSDQKSRPN